VISEHDFQETGINDDEREIRLKNMTYGSLEVWMM
jgi:hypothetical protein